MHQVRMGTNWLNSSTVKGTQGLLWTSRWMGAKSVFTSWIKQNAYWATTGFARPADWGKLLQPLLNTGEVTQLSALSWEISKSRKMLRGWRVSWRSIKATRLKCIAYEETWESWAGSVQRILRAILIAAYAVLKDVSHQRQKIPIVHSRLGCRDNSFRQHLGKFRLLGMKNFFIRILMQRKC